jgi:hypothetical protein
MRPRALLYGERFTAGSISEKKFPISVSKKGVQSVPLTARSPVLCIHFRFAISHATLDEREAKENGFQSFDFFLGRVMADLESERRIPG